ncbi:MAG: hypothetical protein RIT27_501 [Pseudomonadota bacterium]|jgi:hypothetical protein
MSHSPVKVFYAYAHADELLQQTLEKHLSALQYQGIIEGWHDRKIEAGDYRENLVNDYLNKAQLILLLISPDFLASDECYQMAIRALERHAEDRAKVIPILLRPTDMSRLPFIHLSALPSNREPVTLWTNQDAAFVDIAKGIRQTVERLLQRSQTFSKPQGNPFNPSQHISPQRFIGRIHELNEVFSILEEGQSVSLVAEQLMGKTSFLHKIQDHFMQHIPEKKVLLFSGLDSISQSIKNLVEHITEESIESEEPDRVADKLDEWVARNTQNRFIPLIIIDDAEILFERFPVRFLERLRGMLGRISFIFSTQRDLDLIIEEISRTSGLENRLKILRLTLLEETAVETIIQGGSPLLSRADQNLIKEWAGHHPFYVHLFGAHLFNARLQGQSNDIAIDRFYTEAAPKLRRIWSTLPDVDKITLRNLSQGKAITTRYRILKIRGLLTNEGQLFGRILQEWIEQET